VIVSKLKSERIGGIPDWRYVVKYLSEAFLYEPLV
jgi:hypothetical protein